MRYLAVDLGDKRTGLALGDSFTGMASPLEVIGEPLVGKDGKHAPERVLVALGVVIERELDRSDRVVVGLPLNMDGSEGPRAKLVRGFAVALAGRAGREVLLADERRTSIRADELMARSGLTHKQKKARRDAIAAAAILQGVLDGEIEAELVQPTGTGDQDGGGG